MTESQQLGLANRLFLSQCLWKSLNWNTYNHIAYFKVQEDFVEEESTFIIPEVAQERCLCHSVAQSLAVFLEAVILDEPSVCNSLTNEAFKIALVNLLQTFGSSRMTASRITAWPWASEWQRHLSCATSGMINVDSSSMKSSWTFRICYVIIFQYVTYFKKMFLVKK